MALIDGPSAAAAPVQQGRALLKRWEANKPANVYDDDPFLRTALARWLGPARLGDAEAALRQAGADAAGAIEVACRRLDRPEHLPRLEAWSTLGERTEAVLHHPSHHEIGRLVWRSGILSVLHAPGHVALHSALAYLFAQNGEAAHLCSIACTAGLIKAIQRGGTDWMRRDWLPRLLDSDYDRRWHGAQFVTEVQGGSDVGANGCLATPLSDASGRWRLAGEKWFCSNIGADLFAVSARATGGATGTAGLGLFVVPRHREDGAPNGLRIRRLKDKLGTRTLPTAEVDFEDAIGWPLGRVEDGFKLLMGVVINTSRLAVAVGCAGMMRRAWTEAVHYARAREAFGRPLAHFPAVRRQLADMRALAAAALASSLFVAAREDEVALAGAPPEEDAVFRTAVNLNKYVCSADAGLVIHHAIEILGGNGTIEDFSVLPRLYREAPVQESWEGPHNTLMAQLLRDARRSKLHAPFVARVADLLLGVEDPAASATRDAALTVLDETQADLEVLCEESPETAGLHVRGVMGRLGRLLQVAVLLGHGEHALARLLLDHHLPAAGDRLRDARLPALIDEALGPEVSAASSGPEGR